MQVSSKNLRMTLFKKKNLVNYLEHPQALVRPKEQ